MPDDPSDGLHDGNTLRTPATRTGPPWHASGGGGSSTSVVDEGGIVHFDEGGVELIPAALFGKR
jgi:hypothetical protein